MEYDKELKKNPFRNLVKPTKYTPSIPEYSKREVIENPQILTLNTLRGSGCKSKNKSGYWLHIPNVIIKQMGIRVTSSRYDLRAILVKKE